MVDFLVVDFLNPVGAKGLHAGGAGHGGGGDDFRLAAFEEGAEVDFRVQHEFLPAFTVDPKILRGIETGGQAVVGGGDDAVVVVKSRCADLAVRILGTEAGNMGKSHGVLRDAEAFFGHGRSFDIGWGNIKGETILVIDGRSFFNLSIRSAVFSNPPYLGPPNHRHFVDF